MKFKRILTLVVVAFVAICLVGCGETTTEKAVASKINKSTDRLDSVITALEELNYDDIVIDSISPLADSTYNTTDASKVRSTKWYSVGNKSTYNTQNVSKPNQQNAKYVSGQNSEKIDINKQYDKNYISNNCPNCEPNKAYKNYVNYEQNRASTASDNATYLGTRNSSYTPKYVNEVSDSFTRNGLDKYLNRVESCYNKCADCISCNAEIKNQKSMLKQNINECKTLSSKLKDGTIKLNDNEINECNNCLNELSNCTKRLSSTRSNLTLKEREILRLKENFGKNMTDIENAYDKLLSALESRLSYLQDCNDNLCCLCDIINKTNVDMRAAEKNKSNQQDILREQQKLAEEQRQEDTYLNGSTPIVKNKTRNQNTTAKKMNTLTKNQTNGNNKTNVKKFNNINNTKSQNVKKNVTKTNNTTTNKNITNNQTPKRYRGNLEERPVVVDNRNNQNNNLLNDNQNSSFENGQNNQPLTPNNVQNPNTYPYQNAQNPNGVNYNNMPNYNGYGYNGNMPYPPRNIDTYRSIIKNIDTYSPNYLPGNGRNGITNSGILQNEANLNTANNTENQAITNN